MARIAGFATEQEMMDLAFHRLAAMELRTAYGWYAARNATVADRFLKHIDLAVADTDCRSR
jgi:hypothetical protein